MKRLLLLIVAAAGIAMVSCSKDEVVTPENTVTLNKHWFVRMQGPTGTSNYSLFSTRAITVIDHLPVPTDSTRTFESQRLLKDTLAIDDHNLLSPTVRANLKIDVQALTFGAGMYKNWHSEDSVIVKEGKIIKNAARSRSGTIVDSIYLKLAFQSAPGTDHIISGHSRTGFLQDEY